MNQISDKRDHIHVTVMPPDGSIAQCHDYRGSLSEVVARMQALGYAVHNVTTDGYECRGGLVEPEYRPSKRQRKGMFTALNMGCPEPQCGY